jgi:hypothetical protein
MIGCRVRTCEGIEGYILGTCTEEGHTLWVVCWDKAREISKGYYIGGASYHDSELTLLEQPVDSELTILEQPDESDWRDDYMKWKEENN